MSRTSRRFLIGRLLTEHNVVSQKQLAELLQDQQITVTLATLSRDLNAMGAIKVRAPGGGSLYAIPDGPVEQVTGDEQLRRVMAEWVADIGASQNIVVVRTPPGSAHMVASALDRADLSDVLGTVAGDDSLIVVAAEGTPGRTLAARLRVLAGLASEI